MKRSTPSGRLYGVTFEEVVLFRAQVFHAGGLFVILRITGSICIVHLSGYSNGPKANYKISRSKRRKHINKRQKQRDLCHLDNNNNSLSATAGPCRSPSG
jgi:hypothetical protein